nr:non-canonical purine NTP pyrophosphatase [Phytoactinopolyspora alkaliphila]
MATRNQHKVGEIRRILNEAGCGVDLVGVTEFPDVEDVVETGLTFTDNALLKAHAVAAATGLPALADDSGISVDALNGMPGVFSGRWCGRHGDDAANLDLLLAQIKDVPDEQRGASFVCVAALVVPGDTEPARPDEFVAGAPPGRVSGLLGLAPGVVEPTLVAGAQVEIVEEGRVTGRLIREPSGGGGFGYDPVFVPDGHDRTTAEMTPAEKDRISHRGRAFRAIAPHLAALSK